ncbi:MAG: TetR/AcrR family transcriptional regulator [Rhodoblastus sp.]
MKSNVRLGREDWIAGAMKLLAQGGAAAVRVEPLAARLKVTKGSFYWHFRDLADLQEAMRQAWAERSTDWVIERVNASGGDAATRLRKLLELAGVRLPSTEKAIRAWAALDPATAKVVRAVDEKRTAFVRDLLSETGYSDVQAEALARVLTYYVVGELVSGLTPDARYNSAVADIICKPR